MYAAKLAAMADMRFNGREDGRELEDRAFFWLVIAISVAFAWIIAPLYGAVLWGVVLAILFASIHERILAACRRRNLAALATVGVVLVIVIIPLIGLTAAVAREASGVYQRIQSGEVNLGGQFQKLFDAMPTWASDGLNRIGLASFSDLKTKLAEGVSTVGKIVVVHAINVGQRTFDLLLNLFVMLYLLFFLLRDGKTLRQQVEDAVPLRPEIKRDLFVRFAVVIRATVKGNMVVALLQGGIGGLIFWILGIQAALLWGALMAVLSLLPAVGPALVWLPVALYLMATGAVGRGILLIFFGAVVIGLVDNLVRPILVGKDTKMPDYVVLISTLGGIAIFGVNGFVLGPMIAAMFISIWATYGASRAAGQVEVAPP